VHHPEGDAYVYTMQVIDRIAESKERNPNLLLAGILHDTGKAKTSAINPKTGKIVTIGHEEESAKMAREFMNRLKYPNEEKHEVVTLVEYHMEPHHLAIAEATKLKHKNRLLAKVAGGYNKLASNPEKAIGRYKDIMTLAKKDNPDKAHLGAYDELENLPPTINYHRKTKGEDLIAQGYKGKAVGKRLEDLYINQIASINNPPFLSEEKFQKIMQSDKTFSDWENSFTKEGKKIPEWVMIMDPGLGRIQVKLISPGPPMTKEEEMQAAAEAEAEEAYGNMMEKKFANLAFGEAEKNEGSPEELSEMEKSIRDSLRDTGTPEPISKKEWKSFQKKHPDRATKILKGGLTESEAQREGLELGEEPEEPEETFGNELTEPGKYVKEISSSEPYEPSPFEIGGYSPEDFAEDKKESEKE
jgi:putative nucleotidyltransferase with HDIG domain